VRAAFYRLRLRIARLLLTGGALLGLTVVASAARVSRTLRRAAGRRPRVVWGNTPIINIKYWSGALRTAGYSSRTIVTHVYPSNDPADFDVVAGQWSADQSWRDYLLFARILWTSDVVSAFFDFGFLKATPLARLEPALLHIADVKLVLLPFGSDIAVPGHLGPTEAAFAIHYGYVLERGQEIRRRVDRLCRSADFVIKTLQVGYLPRCDAFWSHGLAVDTELWRPGQRRNDADEVVVVHAPNHRQLKGTDAVIAAVDQLRADGHPIRLQLLEGRPNEEVRDLLRAADIAVDQLLTGYGLFAVEAMAAGVPVVSNLRWMPDWMRRAPSLAAAPIVDADESDIADRLRELVVDADLRQRLGRESRRFAVEYHSYAASGSVWAAIIEHVWRGAPVPSELLPR
jgi:glycosyltransferase involved in cell wall biosynthesis